MKALSANHFLKAFVQTFPMAYYTCPGHKNFSFQLPGKCAARPASSTEHIEVTGVIFLTLLASRPLTICFLLRRNTTLLSQLKCCQ